MFFLHHSYSVEESGLLKGATDWHCHVLPGVDDGVKTMEESLSVLSVMEKVGVRHVNLTPHIMEDVPNTPEGLRERFAELRGQYKGGMELTLAAENMLDNLFSERLESGALLTICSDKLLVETSYFNPPYRMDYVISDILTRDITPVLAHPERYVYMEEKDYRKLRSMHILFQLNLPSLVGIYGSRVQRKAEMILSNGWYDVYGTDTHSLRFYDAFLHGRLRRRVIDQVKAIPNDLNLK